MRCLNCDGGRGYRAATGQLAGAFAGDDVDATIVPHTSGLMIPRNWPKVIDAPYADCGKIGLAYGLSLYMPWWGVTRGGKSAMLIFETPDDAGIQLYHSPENGTTVSPKWIHSLGKMNYTRRAGLNWSTGTMSPCQDISQDRSGKRNVPFN